MSCSDVHKDNTINVPLSCLLFHIRLRASDFSFKVCLDSSILVVLVVETNYFNVHSLTQEKSS